MDLTITSESLTVNTRYVIFPWLIIREEGKPTVRIDAKIDMQNVPVQYHRIVLTNIRTTSFVVPNIIPNYQNGTKRKTRRWWKFWK